ncbi:MAG: hypothetical protein ABI823_10230, partial [Bryobacteraceae bacterium]
PIAITSCARKPGTGFPGYAFVANRTGHAVAVVDLNAFAVARHVRLDAAPTQVAAPLRRAAVYALTPETGMVHEIRTDTLAVARTARPAGRASGMQLSPDESALWVLAPESKKLVRLGLANLDVQAQILLPATPTTFHVAANGKTAAVGFGAAGLALIDLEQRRCGDVMSSGGAIGQVRFQFNSRTLIAANLDQRLLSLYDAPSGQLIVHLPLAVRPDRLCFNSDGGQLFITGEGSDGVVVVYPYRAEVSGTVLAGRAPGEMAASGDPQYLFVASPKSGDVSILNIDTLRVIAAVSVGTEPCYITITPDDQFALVLNKTSGDMAVLRVGAITAKRNKSAPLFTMIPVGSEPVSAVVRAV